jgi:Tol biopolymer transport system component
MLMQFHLRLSAALVCLAAVGSGFALLAGLWLPPARVLAYHQRDYGVRLVDVERGVSPYAPVARGSDAGRLHWSPDGAWMTFAEYGGIVVADGYGRRLAELRDIFVGDTFRPAWSRDSRAFVFGGIVNSVTDLWAYDIESQSLANLTLTDNFIEHSPIWRDDGGSIVFTGFDARTGRSGVYVLDVASGQRRQVIEGSSFSYQTSQSPDGSKLALTSTGGAAARALVIADVERGSLHVPSDTRNLNNIFPGWSADGAYLAWIAVSGYNQRDIVVFDTATDRILQVIPSLWAFYRWSPNEQRLLYLDRGDLYLLDVAGGEVRKLTHWLWVNADWGSVDWSPDGSSIAFVSNRAGRSVIYMVDAETGSVRRLTTNDRSILPTWRP